MRILFCDPAKLLRYMRTELERKNWKGGIKKAPFHIRKRACDSGAARTHDQ